MAANMSPHPLALPPGLTPDALDVATEMSLILTRLRNAIQVSPPSGGVTGTTPAPIASTPSALSSAGPGSALSLKDVPTATDNLKHKLQRARVLVRTLPDMTRSVAEQEAEMRALEARIVRQREVLGSLREAGVGFVRGNSVDVKMET